MNRLRPKTKKRAAIDRKAKPIRDALIERVGRCEFCGGHETSINPLIVHEIARGIHRLKAQSKAYATLVLHWYCHPTVQGFHPAKQLALLKHRRPKNYKLKLYYKLIGRRFPDEEDIETELNQLISDEVHE